MRLRIADWSDDESNNRPPGHGLVRMLFINSAIRNPQSETDGRPAPAHSQNPVPNGSK